MAIGHEDHALEIVADQRLEGGAQFYEIARELAVENRLGRLHGCEHAGAARDCAFAPRLDDDVGDQTGKVDVVRADGEEDEIESPASLPTPGARQEVAKQ